MISKKAGVIFQDRVIFDQLTTLRKQPEASFTIMKWLRDVINPTLELVSAEQKVLLTEYGGPTENGEGLMILETDEDYPKFIEQWTAYLQKEIEIDDLGLTLEELVAAVSGIEGNVMSEAFLFAIESYCKDYVAPVTDTKE